MLVCVYAPYYFSNFILTELIKTVHVGIRFIEEGKYTAQMFKY